MYACLAYVNTRVYERVLHGKIDKAAVLSLLSLHQHLSQALKRNKTTQAVKTTTHIYGGEGNTLVPRTVKQLHHSEQQKAPSEKLD